MGLKLEEWGGFEKVGEGYAFMRDERFHSLLETKKGAYRGNHVHPHDQYTLLLSGKGRYVKYEDGFKEIPLKIGDVFMVGAGVPHILVPEEDCITFEWWDGDFIQEDCEGLFDDLVRDRVGPQDYLDV